MRSRRHEISTDFAVIFDNENGAITVSRYVRLVPNFYGEWEDVAIFTNETAWYASEYPSKVVGDDNIAMIAYFWYDIAQSAL